MSRINCVLLFNAFLFCCLSSTANSQVYPSKPTRIFVGFAAGGGRLIFLLGC